MMSEFNDDNGDEPDAEWEHQLEDGQQAAEPDGNDDGEDDSGDDHDAPA